MLALAVVVFALRALASETAWARAERLIRFGFWGLNVGLALMIVLDLFPAGVLQLWDSIANGYWHARQPAFTMHGPFHTLEWVRLIGDGVFLIAGVVPLVTATLMVVLDPATSRSDETPTPASTSPRRPAAEDHAALAREIVRQLKRGAAGSVIARLARARTAWTIPIRPIPLPIEMFCRKIRKTMSGET